MLARAHRLHRSEDFAAVLKGGTRAGRTTLTVHVRTDPCEGRVAPSCGAGDPAAQGEEAVVDRESALLDQELAPVRAGLVVSKGVGNAVARHRVSRRLRHLLVPYVTGPQALNPGLMLVVRASPAAAGATYASLADDLSSAVRSAVSKRART